MVIQALESRDWQAVGHGTQWLDSPFFTLAPWILVALVAVLLARAFATRRRYRAVDVLTPADHERVRTAIAAVEASTSADVVPLVVERADPQTHTLLLAAAAFCAVANVLLLGWLPQRGFVQLGLAEIALCAVGLGLAWISPDLRRCFLTRRRADATTGEQALIELSRLAQGKSSAQLVLLFVSLFEHRVIVLANSPVASAVAPEHWPKAVEAVLGGVRRGRLADGLVAGIAACTSEMQRAFPPGEPRENRFADRAITRRE